MPDHSTAVGIPARIVVQNGERINHDVDQGKQLQSVIDDYEELKAEIASLKQELIKLKGENEYDNKGL